MQFAMTRDARLPALHRGGFGVSGSRASLPASPASACASADPARLQRAPRVQVLVPGWRGPSLPGRRLRAAAAGTPPLAPYSGCLENTPLTSKAANLLLRTHIVVKTKIQFVDEKFAPPPRPPPAKAGRAGTHDHGPAIMGPRLRGDDRVRIL